MYKLVNIKLMRKLIKEPTHESLSLDLSVLTTWKVGG